MAAGASQGAGRGIAVQRSVAAAAVYVAGRTTRSRRSEMNRPETMEEAAALADEARSGGMAVAVDHLVSDEVRARMTRIQGDQGGL